MRAAKCLLGLLAVAVIISVLGWTVAASPERKIVVVAPENKDEIMKLVQQLGGQVINELKEVENLLIIDIPPELVSKLKETGKEGVQAVHDDVELRIIPPRELISEWEQRRRREDKEKPEEGRPSVPLEQTIGDDWGFDRIDAEEVIFPAIHRIIGQAPTERRDGSPNLALLLIGAVGLVGAGLARRRNRGLFVLLALIGLPLVLAGCVGVSAINLGQGIRVAIIDTGIDSTHPDLNNNVNNGLSRNCLTGVCVTFPGGAAQDDNGHGTFVASIVAAELNNAGDHPADNKIGVAPKAEVVAIKVCTAGGSCPTSALLAGIAYASTIGAQVANMSIGTGPILRSAIDTTSCDVEGTTPTPGTVFQGVIDAFLAAGGTLVVAAGNSSGNLGPASGLGALFASCKNTFSVAATDKNDQMAWFTNSGDDVDTAAPGWDVFGANTRQFPSTFMCFPARINYCPSGGTSFAAPYVAGLIALLRGNGFTESGARAKVLATADAVIAPRTGFGAGPAIPKPIIDVEEAVVNTQNGDN